MDSRAPQKPYVSCSSRPLTPLLCFYATLVIPLSVVFFSIVVRSCSKVRRNRSWLKELVAQRHNEGLSGRLWARGAMWEVARERGCVREVAGERACSGGCGRGGVCGGCLRCLRSSSSSFLCRDGVLGYAGFFIFLCVRDGVLGFHAFFFLRLRLLWTRSFLFDHFHERAHNQASAMAGEPFRSLFSSVVCVMRKLQIVTSLDRLKFSSIALQLDTSNYSA